MDKVKTSVRFVKSRNRKNLLPTIGFAGEDYERFYFLYTSDGLDGFLVLEPLYLLYEGLEFDNYFKKIYKDCFGFKFPFIEISYKELNILFFLKLMDLEYYKEDIFEIIYILLKKGYICLMQNNNNIDFNKFSRGESIYDKDIHILNNNDKIYITNDGVRFVQLLFNNNGSNLIQNAKQKYLNSNRGIIIKESSTDNKDTYKEIRIDFINGTIFSSNNNIILELTPKFRNIISTLYKNRKEGGMSLNNIMVIIKQKNQTTTKKTIKRINDLFKKNNISNFIHIDYKKVDKLYFITGSYNLIS